MTNDKQIEAVARAIYDNLREQVCLTFVLPSNCVNAAEAAIAASGAEHIPMLVEALKKCQTTATYIYENFMDIDGLPVGHIGAIEDAALHEGGIKHPQQAEWDVMIAEVKKLRRRVKSLASALISLDKMKSGLVEYEEMVAIKLKVEREINQLPEDVKND